MDIRAAQRRADQFSFQCYAEPVELSPPGGNVNTALRAIVDHLGRYMRDLPGNRSALDNQQVDFVFSAEELYNKPERGWLIRHAGLTYQVLPENGRAAWEYEPGDFVFVRVHTKRVRDAQEANTTND